MTTEVLKENEVTDEMTVSETASTRPDVSPAELDKLLRFKKAHVRNDNFTPCSACTTLVPVTANECPHCQSSIAANNALVRETLRSIEEIEGRLNREHEARMRWENRSLWERFRGLFSSAKAPEFVEDPLTIETGPRSLDHVTPDARLIVVAKVGSWLEVKTADGKPGWVYSTIVDPE